MLRAGWVQRVVGFLAAEFLRLVWLTNKFSYEPKNFYEVFDPQTPVILVFWHGQHFMTPFVKRANHQAKVLISRHRDGEINALAAGRLGVGSIRGSGDHGADFHRKGAVGAFRELVRTLKSGCNVAMTADVPKESRVAGLGPIMLARLSGRPIVPVALATSRYIRLDNWDHTTINLPFGRGAVVSAESLTVAADADVETMEALRVRLEALLNDATRRAYAMIGRPEGAA